MLFFLRLYQNGDSILGSSRSSVWDSLASVLRPTRVFVCLETIGVRAKLFVSDSNKYKHSQTTYIGYHVLRMIDDF